ncbi:MAG: type II toxin-antitoxin system mRNA interferase toxin, RelE/StbE family [Desulfobacula sp.]|nr:type II toxin-antitoxin system mRNA interferase toxin, RelE/StbE family [Desulfobacula sp.]MDA8134257.1 type II toxin-antitoxin system mRNA interferase toxin, RelE/StbE family [Desulfobacteraceae bacterium]
MNQVRLSRKVQKQLKKVPVFIAVNLQTWVEQVEMFGISQVRRIPGYHDEPLHGERLGQRSIRLSKAYRAFYTEDDDHIIIDVMEVNKHEY